MTGKDGHSPLRERREYLGLSREKVAAQLDVSSKTIERWEKIGRPPKRFYLRMLAELYECDEEDLAPEAIAA